ncbi:MAG TPA: DEAD/DEAH box helicase family protein [Polyangiaceae bacterium]
MVVDECHRGYLLDRELSDRELLFRDEDDYISKYRRVLDHFDAVKIGLTATPPPQTRASKNESKPPSPSSAKASPAISSSSSAARPPNSSKASCSICSTRWATAPIAPTSSASAAPATGA